MPEKPTALKVALSKAWPNLRYLSIGVWLAWLFMISSGMVWLSDTEFDGTYVAELILGISIIGALLCFISPLITARVEALLGKRAFIIGIALAATLGALAIIAAGPYYLATPPLFYVGIVLVSLFSSVFVLKCGSLYGKLDSRRVLLFSLYSEILMVVLSYFFIGNDFFALVSGGPSLMGILAFALLPPVAAWLVCLPSSNTETEQNAAKRPSQEEQFDESARESSDSKPSIVANEKGYSQQDPLENTRSGKSRFPSDFWKLLLMIFFFTLVSEMFRNYFVYVRMPDITFIDAKIVLLLRLGFALALLFYALRTKGEIRFSKMYQYSLVTLAVVVSLIPLLLEQSTILSSLTGGISAYMSLLIWCLLSMVVYERNMSFVVVFGLGWGMVFFARACGWLLGISVIPALMETSWNSWIYWATAILILVTAILFFSETRLDKLFGNIAKGQISLVEANPAEEPEKERRPWHEAAMRIGEQAKLSQRELEILELISIGRSPKNVANHFVVSVNTVRTHIRNIYVKLDVHSHEELVRMIEQEIKEQEE